MLDFGLEGALPEICCQFSRTDVLQGCSDLNFLTGKLTSV